MIPEWLKFQNEFRSRMKFVLHSRDKIELPSLRCPRSRRFCARPDTHAPLAPDYVWHDLQWYQDEISYQNENFILSENGNELIPEWLVREWNVVIYVNKYRKIQREWNEHVPKWKSLRDHVNSHLQLKRFKTPPHAPTPSPNFLPFPHSLFFLDKYTQIIFKRKIKLQRKGQVTFLLFSPKPFDVNPPR